MSTWLWTVVEISKMTHITQVLLAVCVALSLGGGSDAARSITCLTFEDNYQGSKGVWTSHQNLLRVGNAKVGKKCAQFSGLTDHYTSQLSIPRFAHSFDAWSAFSLTFWFKTGDDKTSVLFHNDLCDDKGSLEVVIYNSGMLNVNLMLSTMHTADLFVFMSRNDWHHVAVVWTGSRVNVYVDGDKRDSASLSGGRIYNSWCPLVVGGHPKNIDEDIKPYKGFMDQICTYGQALSGSQVRNMFNNP